MRPCSGMHAPQQYSSAVEASTPLPDPALRAPSGYPPGSHSVALLGIVLPATACAVPYDHPDFTSNTLNEICSALP
ncbi:MAG TPA: hypothetical protein VF243_05770 [Nitrosospira sp.]